MCIRDRTKGGGGAVPLPPERVLEVSGRASMGNMVNRAVVTGRNGRVLAAAQNTGDITACGPVSYTHLDVYKRQPTG